MKNKNFDLIVFDWDGTLVDSTAHIAWSIQKAYGDAELPIPTQEDARHVIGLGLSDTFQYLSPSLTSEQHKIIVERYRHHFLTADEKIQTFEYVEEGLRFLSGQEYQLAVATGKSRVGLDRALKEVSFGGYFNGTRCGDEGFPKPHPDMLLHLMAEFAAEPERTLMIGDTTHDLELARNAGAQSVGVTYGAHGREKLEKLNPRLMVNEFRELIEWLKVNG